MQDAQKPEASQAAVKPTEFKPELLLKIKSDRIPPKEFEENWRGPDKWKKENAWEDEYELIKSNARAKDIYDTSLTPQGQRKVFEPLTLIVLEKRGIKVNLEEFEQITDAVSKFASDCQLDLGDGRSNTDILGFINKALDRVFEAPEQIPTSPEINSTKEEEGGVTASQNQSLAHAGNISPETARSIIDLMAKGNDLPKVLETRVAELKKDGASPEDLALALDLELAGIEWRLSAIHEKLQKGRKISPKLETELSDLSNKHKDLSEQRNSGKVKLSDGSIKEIANFDKQPNQIKKLAEKLGIVDTNNPLEKMQNFIEEAVGNKEFRDQFTAKIMKLTDEGLLTREQATQFNKFLEDSAKNKSIENKAKFAAKGAAFGGLFMFLMLYLAKKQSGSQGGGGMMG